MWNETDRDARDALLATAWEADARYVDPLVDVTGSACLSDVIGAVHEQYPGFVFSPVGALDAHHGVARFRWGLGAPGQEPAAVGSDVVTLNDAGRITSVTGFLDRLPG